MNRRKFLYAGGTILAASTVLSANQFLRTENGATKRIHPDTFEQPVLKGIAYGLNAPNPHNTQAWKFKVLSDTELLFYADETRLLKATDPTTRQIHIGCGCFLECCKIGMTLDGFITRFELFPDAKPYKEASIGQSPIAKITFEKAKNISPDPLATLIFKRRTSRLKYSDAPVRSEDFKKIVDLIRPQHSMIELTNTNEKLNQILPILAEGMSVETYTFRTHEESRKWFRENDDKIAQNRDGINLAGNGVGGIKKWIAERQLKGLEQDKWHSKKLNAYSLNAHNDRVLTSKGVITLKTTENDFKDWVNAGIDYMRLQLACQQYNYYIHPLSQVLQEFEEMKALRQQFEQAMNVNGTEKIQMVVRVGKSKEPYLSYRRKPDSLVV